MAVYIEFARESGGFVSRGVHKEVANNNGHCLRRGERKRRAAWCVDIETKRHLRTRPLFARIAARNLQSYSYCTPMTLCKEQKHTTRLSRVKPLILMP